MSKPNNVSPILKISIFATGAAGIVAEFVLSTLATYIVGNAVFQWAIVMSLMLFAMGVGSRLSSFFKKQLLDTFILIEFSLSLLCASSAALAYGLSSQTNYTGLVIYTQAFIIGVLIGLEIPLVTRMNQDYQELRQNIAAVLEKDYFGALAGGLFFAFVALPFLGLTYTPIILGAVNFLVAALLLWRFYGLVKRKTLLRISFLATTAILVFLAIFGKSIVIYGEQRGYKDKVIYAQQTAYQKIIITKWKKDYWLFINGQEQFSTYDEEKYHEPLVHPGMFLTADKSSVLILGGGDGLALREVLKHKEVKTVTLVDIDPAMTDLSKTHPILTKINENSLTDERVNTVNKDAAVFLRETGNLYGMIIIDLPDPDSVDLMHLYSLGFYRLAKKHLVKGGLMVTQASSPYFAKQAFLSILKTIQAAGFSTLPYHNQIPTMGEWGFVLAARQEDQSAEILKRRSLTYDYSGLATRFFNLDAMISMAHFGKGVLDEKDFAKIKINTESNPVLQRYYNKGTWGVY